jgi:hypothetical protein
MTKRRFSASSQRITSDFYRLMIDLGATSLKINQDIMKGDVEAHFDRSGMRYVFRCSQWGDVMDNLRAIYHRIRHLYMAFFEYGVTSDQQELFDDEFQRVFGGFIATPDDTVLMLTDGSQQWWEILGVEKGATREAAKNAYRALAKVHHPDAGGDPDDFKRLRKAYDQAMAQLK